MTDSSYAKSIELPTDQIFRNLKNAKRFAIDIGLYPLLVMSAFRVFIPMIEDHL